MEAINGTYLKSSSQNRDGSNIYFKDGPRSNQKNFCKIMFQDGEWCLFFKKEVLYRNPTGIGKEPPPFNWQTAAKGKDPHPYLSFDGLPVADDDSAVDPQNVARQVLFVNVNDDNDAGQRDDKDTANKRNNAFPKCDWAHVITCNYPHLKPSRCIFEGCKILVHHVCQGDYEREHGYDEHLPVKCRLHHPNSPFIAQKQPPPPLSGNDSPLAENKDSSES
jgi:hypothetical protein